MSRRGYACVGLDRPKNPWNVGGVLRACGAFGVAMVAATGKRYERAATDTGAAYRHLPLVHGDDLRALIPFDCVPVAIELVPGALPLATYRHPERAFYVLGPEDGSIHPDVLAWCRDVVYVPTAHCLNLAATANVVLYDRCAKRAEWPATLAESAESARAIGGAR